jgi:hypothetical protein
MFNIPVIQFLRKREDKPTPESAENLTIGYMKVRCPICGYIQNLRIAVKKNEEDDNTVVINEGIVETFYNQAFVTLAENHNCTAKPKTLIKMDFISIELTDACIIQIPELI